ncbi:hypothetical protein Y1Q_0021512 [Alligator mississippiensis]|uniref:Uncharacterized protein n=1 Tax=Alligator mississippiensis TaxID=8496 RepID=A0A151PA25_ALLMI|nr:hypothetical protein Y1Q_0021512 [Alligator mississippiensis]
MYGLQASAVLSAPAAACTEPASIQQGLSGKKPPTEMEFSIGKETSKEVRANKQACTKCGRKTKTMMPSLSYVWIVRNVVLPFL